MPNAQAKIDLWDKFLEKIAKAVQGMIEQKARDMLKPLMDKEFGGLQQRFKQIEERHEMLLLKMEEIQEKRRDLEVELTNIVQWQPEEDKDGPVPLQRCLSGIMEVKDSLFETDDANSDSPAKRCKV
jgi:hypothetical protein